MATEARYTAQINGLIRPEPRDEMYAIANDHGVSFAEILRTVIDLGLPHAKAHYDALMDAKAEIAAATALPAGPVDPAAAELARAARRG